MKKITYLFFLLSISFMSAQDIAFTFENPQITNDGMNDFYEVDVMVSGSTDFLLGTGQFYINYNTTAFGLSIETSGAGVFDNTGGAMLGSPGYWNLIYTDNTDSRVSYAFVQLASSGFYTDAQTVTSTPKLLTHLRIQYLAGQTGTDPGICFESGDGFTDLNFTACGGGFGADCLNFPGIQITDDTFDCSGAIILCGSSTTYTIAGGWDNGAPDAMTEAIIAEDYNTADGNITACSLTVNAGATLSVGAGEYISVENDITVDGTLQVAHQGSVVQVNDDASVTNNGTINVGMTTPVLKPRDFMMIGSPMTGVTREGDLAGANRVMSHDTSLFVPNPDVAAAFPMAENFADDNFNDYLHHTGVLNPGEGYLLRPRPVNAVGNEATSYTFNQGTLNNGVVNYNVTFQVDQNNSYNLLANPYPSAINVDDFINANAMIGEVYYWEHVQSPSAAFPGANSVNFSMEDVSMYNLLGGVAAASNPATTPNEYMSSVQGFGIKASAGGTAVFNNAMRVVDNNNTLRTADATMDRIWLTVSSRDYDVTGSALVGFTDNATAGLDNGYDSDRLATAISLYSHLEDGSMELGIQGREAFAINKVVSMGFTTSIAENTAYEIKIADLQGAGIETATVYLVDTYTNTIHNLSEGGYIFSTDAGVENSRFILQFEDKNVLSTDDIALNSISLYPNPTRGKLTIVAPQTTIDVVTVVDMNGSIISTQRGTEASNLELDMSTMSSAIYFVQIETPQGVVTKRVVKE